MHQTPVEPSGSQFADHFQFLGHETVNSEMPIDCVMSFSSKLLLCSSRMSVIQWGLRRGGRGEALGHNTKGCLRVHYCLCSVTVYTG